MGVVNVTYLKSSTVTAQTTWSQCIEPSFMSKLCKRVNLVHELGKLATTEEFLDGRNNWLDGDKILWFYRT